MIRTIELPQVGESVTEGVIGKWLVEPGQRVEKYDPLVEVVTDKVSMEAPSPYTGVFVRALAEEGETVPMGRPICEMDIEGDEPPIPLIPSAAEESLGAAPTSVDPAPPPVIPAQAGIQDAPAAHEAGSEDEGEAEGGPAGDAGDAPGEEDAGRVGGAWAMPAAQGADAQGEEAEHPTFEFMDSVRSVGPTGSGERGEGRPDALQEQALAEHEQDAPEESAPQSPAGPDRSHVISPLVARLSAQYGIDLSTVRGTGTGGRITSKDLLEAVSSMTSQTEEEAASPVIPAQAGVLGGQATRAGAAHEEAAGPVEGLEAPAEPETEAVAEQPAPEEAIGDVEEEAADQPLFEEDIEETLDAAEEEPAAEEPAAEEPAADAADAVEESLVVPAEAGTSQPTEPQPAAEDTSVMPLTPVRRIIAEHMARSSREIPAAWAMVEADATRLVRTRDALKAAFEERHGVPLTYLPFAAAAVATALREHPRLNARWDDGHITLNNRVSLAIAVSTEAGLMAPVLRDADTLTIADIAAELRPPDRRRACGDARHRGRAGAGRSRSTTPAHSAPSSPCPSSNHPQAAIMTTEAIVKRPVVVEGDAIAVRSMMNLCLTFDHRVCDGAEAAAFLSAVKARLEAIDESTDLG